MVFDAREQRGLKQGLQQGANRVRELMHILAGQGYSVDEILAMTASEEDREKLYKQYEIV